MKKVIIIPDSFKGTLSSEKICEIVSNKVKEYFPACKVISIPVADGGEGSVACFLRASGGEKVTTTVKNPYFEDMESFFGIIDGGKTAVIEMAACAGLPLIENRKNPELTTTYGVGQLILEAAKRGCEKIIVGLGGSCTNDGGAGAAAAIGIKFLNQTGDSFIPTGGTLGDTVHIDCSSAARELKNVKIISMCDIDNPMYGKTGAAYIFGPQKGADEEMVIKLDQGLFHFGNLIKQDMKMDVTSLPGGGAAGAMGAGMAAFFRSTLQMGIETVLDTVNFDDIISDADMIITGEGKMDAQSLRGKVVIGVGKRAQKQEIPVIVLAGGVEDDLNEAYQMGISAAFSINRLPEDFSVSRYKSEKNMELTVDNLLRFLKCMKK